MTERGVGFLENWINENIQVHPRRIVARKLGKQLRIDSASVGLTIDDLEIDKSSVEQYIWDAMLNREGPGTPGD